MNTTVVDPNTRLTYTVATPKINIEPVEKLVNNSSVVRINLIYNKIINIYSENGITEDSLSFKDILVPDQNYSFFQEILKEGLSEINEELNSAVNFITYRYGVNLSSFENRGNTWQNGLHTFYPFRKSLNQIAVQLGGNCCTATTYNCYEGGFVLVVGAPGIVARGTYGKDAGENILPGSIILYGYYVLVDEYNNGIIYHYRSNVPSMTNVDVPLSWNLDVYDYKTKSWGKAIGSIIINRKDIIIESVVKRVVPRITYVPNTVEVNSPRVIQTRTSTTLQQSNGLVTRSIPINQSNQINLEPSKVEVPSYAPVIREEIESTRVNESLIGELITRNVITFYS